jgi:hypothetical protein
MYGDGCGERTDGIVHGLIDGGSHPASFIAKGNHFCHLEGGIVAQSQLAELALLVQLVDFLQRLSKRH